MRRTKVLTLLLIAVALPAQEARRPNILFIVSDDQGWNDIGYHNPKIRTPNLDALARGGVELDCHYVQPQCTPTRVALMTGRYPCRFKNGSTQASNALAFPMGTPTLASLLKTVGYTNGMSGKWHLGSKPEWGPNHHGFDYSHGSLAGAVGMYDHRYRLSSPFAVTWHRNHEIIEEEGHVTDLTAREAVKWIEDHAQSSGPWFFYVPFHAVHTPIVEKDPKWSAINAHFERDDRRAFAAAVSHMDDAVGQMVSALDRTGQRRDTLIVFTSDNGAQVNYRGGNYPAPDPSLKNFSSNEPLRGQKTGIYEGGYRVPAFANWPGSLEPRKCEQPMHIVDWVPTIARLAGYEIPSDLALDGRDAWPWLSAAAAIESRTFYIVWGRGRQRVALRHGDLKILKKGKNAAWELYDLGRDPHETKNLADERPADRDRLIEVLRRERAKDPR